MAKRAKSKAKAKAKAKRAPQPKRKLKKAAKIARPNAKAKAKAKAKSRPKAAPKRARRPEVPQGYGSVTAYLIAQDAGDAIRWYQDVFGAAERLRMPAPGNKIGHAELEIGDTVIMIADEFPDMDARGPQSIGGTPVTLMIYVPDVDATVERAVAKGGKVTRPVEDKFYGDRSGTITDPQGHVWHISTRVEDVPEEEILRRMEKMMQGQG